mmetsp:Transcript_6767/g.19787  ORF Transcript_6767/g.19787 Transcript_6767/m.19787 type:complete len:242 (-) Transcript_6767:3118-3843(-)
MVQSRPLQRTLHRLGLVLVRSSRPKKINRQRRRLDILSNVDDFCQTRNSKGHILGRHTGVMESVQSHLCRGLPNALRRNDTNVFARVSQSLVEFLLDLTSKPVECFCRQPVLLADLLRCKGGPQVHFEQGRRIFLSLLTQGVVSLHNLDTFLDFFDLLNHVERIQVCLLAQRNFELLGGVLNQTTEVNRQVYVVIAVRYDLYPGSLHVRQKLVVLFIETLLVIQPILSVQDLRSDLAVQKP